MDARGACAAGGEPTIAYHQWSDRAIVLRTRPLGEKDRIMVLLTPTQGKIAAVAKGARGAKSKLSAVSQPFTLARFMFAQGRSLSIATQAEIEEPHRHICADLLKTAWATYLCELCDILPEEFLEPTLFELMEVTLAHLEQSEGREHSDELVGRWFEAHFLALLGYAPTIGRCAACSDKIVVAAGDLSARIAFSAPLGGTLCTACATGDGRRLLVCAGSLRLLHRLERLSAPPRPSEVAAYPTLRRDLRDVLRTCLQEHLELRPKSLEFLEDVIASAPIGQNPKKIV